MALVELACVIGGKILLKASCPIWDIDRQDLLLNELIITAITNREIVVGQPILNRRKINGLNLVIKISRLLPNYSTTITFLRAVAAAGALNAATAAPQNPPLLSTSKLGVLVAAPVCVESQN